jgi:hypothetical protein
MLATELRSISRLCALRRLVRSKRFKKESSKKVPGYFRSEMVYLKLDVDCSGERKPKAELLIEPNLFDRVLNQIGAVLSFRNESDIVILNIQDHQIFVPNIADNIKFPTLMFFVFNG